MPPLQRSSKPALAGYPSALVHSSSANADNSWPWRAGMPCRRSIYQREYAEVGGLISYGPSQTDALSPRRCLCRPDSQRRKAGDLPVEQGTNSSWSSTSRLRRRSALTSADAAGPRRRGDRVRRREFIRAARRGRRMADCDGAAAGDAYRRHSQ